jgi:two-component system sensor histidine kinase BaeS
MPLTAAGAAALAGSMVRSGRKLLGPLGWRLFAAFMLVGVGAVALLAALAVVSVRSQTTSLVAAQRTQARHDIAAALAAAYTQAGSWPKADLAGAQALADSTGATMIILGVSGQPVTTITPGHRTGRDHGPEPGHGTGGTDLPGMGHGEPSTSPSGQHHGGDSVTTGARVAGAASASPAVTARSSAAGPARVPVIANGRRVGTALIDFPAASQTSAWQARDAILRAVGAGALLAVLLAAAAALIVSRRTTRPLTALAAAAGAVERGDPAASSLLRSGPGELGQVSAAFARMAATLRREDELRRAMVADTAHELRTPVTILRGGTEELLDGLADPTPAKLTSLHDEVLRLERLVEDLSALAAAQSAALSLDRAPAELAKLADHAAAELQPLFEDAAVHLSVHTEPAPVNGDAGRITQIITNLLTNAAKFTPPGGQVTLTTRPVQDQAELTVSDTGPGIPANDLPHIFERFWRGTAAAGRAGTGIGLAVAAELAAAHGGTLTATSPPGGGAIFTLTLPAV